MQILRYVVAFICPTLTVSVYLYITGVPECTVVYVHAQSVVRECTYRGTLLGKLSPS